MPIRRRTDSPRRARREEAAARRTLRVMRRTPGILLTVLTNRISIARCQLSGRIIFDRLGYGKRTGTTDRAHLPPRPGIRSGRAGVAAWRIIITKLAIQAADFRANGGMEPA